MPYFQYCMNKILFSLLNVFAACLLCSFLSCSKSPSNPNGSNPGGGSHSDTIPANIVDITPTGGNLTITLTPYPGFVTIPNLIPTLSIGYYYIDIGGSDSLTFLVEADSSSGGNAAISSQTSDSGPNDFTSGDTLEFLGSEVEFSEGNGDTGKAYFTTDLARGYEFSNGDTLSFSDPYTVGQIYSSYLPTNNNYNLLNTTAYIAFRLKNHSGYRYGWIEIATEPGTGNLLSVLEIAYNKDYYAPIGIGLYK
jgi:hypothetical protein